MSIWGKLAGAAAGLAIGAILLWFRAPAVLAMLVAAIACALLRLAT